MKLLDKYILKKYLGTFIYLVLGLCMIICVIDFSEKNDDFLKLGLNFKDVFLGYYAHLIPYLANFLSPLMVFISTILVTARLASHTEIVAMLAGGISFKRILWIYVMGAILLAGVTFYLIGWVIPVSNTKRVEFELTYLKEDHNFEVRNVHLRASDSSYVYVQHYNSAINTGYQFTYEVMKGNDVAYRLKTSKILWDTVKNVWSTKNYSERTYENDRENYQFHVKDKEINIGILPEDFNPGNSLHQCLTIPELRNYIEKESKRGTAGLDVFIIEYYERFTYPFAIIILTCMGVIVSARKSREGIAKQLVVGFLLCFVYYSFLQLGRNFTQSESLHPLLSAWIPNIIFTIAGLIMYRFIPK